MWVEGRGEGLILVAGTFDFYFLTFLLPFRLGLFKPPLSFLLHFISIWPFQVLSSLFPLFYIFISLSGH